MDILKMGTQVSTSMGIVEGGMASANIRVFKGIPYAAPPIGELRWKPTEEAKHWHGVRSALDFGPDCPQTMNVGSRATSQSEDCLYLNIWTPVSATTAALPVLVWIHGGSYLGGSGSEARLDGTRIAQEGAVVVTFNYRVGVFGFLAHPKLTQESTHHSSSNYALLDQITALKWIRKNIVAFGGDPTRVTAFGVSAGSASISLLLASPMGKGLFDRAILESPGAGRNLASLEEAEIAGLALGSDIDELRKFNSQVILDMTSRLTNKVRGLTSPRILRPIRDGWIIPEDERGVFIDGRLHRMPIIVGVNADEGTQATSSWPIDTIEDYTKLLNSNFGSMSSQAQKLYPVEDQKMVRASVAELFADTQFNYGARLLSLSMARSGYSTWNYLFSRRRSYQNDGPHHGQEVHFVFGNLEAPYPGEKPIFDEADKKLSLAMIRYWISFAATGSPEGNGLNEWPQFDEVEERYLEFGDVIHQGQKWRKDKLDFMERFFGQS
ncbi:MAG: carboxylesterase family protein [Betaproteobacteria bacterium]